MNDHRLPPDELASAFLDDELTAPESEAVRQDPELTARADALRRTAEAVGETVTPPPGAADAAVEAALADFDARRHAPVDMTRRRPRGFAVITGVAAAVAVGFIVAAAVGLFAEREASDEDAVALPAAAPEPAAEAAAVAPEPPPAPAAEAPPPPDLALATPPAAPAEPAPAPPATVLLPAEEFSADEAPDAALAQAQTAADDARAATAQAEAAAAAAPEAAVEAAPPPPAAAEPAPADVAAADDPEERTTAADTDEMDPPADIAADPLPEEVCVAAIGERAVELRFSQGGSPILIVRDADGTISALDGTTCAQIPPEDGTEAIADPAPDGCSGATGDGTVELRLGLGGSLVLIVRDADGTISALDGTTCAQIPSP